jgi:phosphonatase-like hydrolase
MKQPLFDLVVFDLAGTTVYDRDDVTHCLRETLKLRASLEIDLKEANTLLGRAKDVGMAEVLSNHGKPHEAGDPFVQELLADFEERMIHHYLTHPSVKELSEASKVFSQLKSIGVKIGVDTGFSVKVTSALIDRMGWQRAGLLDAWTSCDQVKKGRPAPYMIYRLMETLDVPDVSRVIKIGDTPNDIKMGRAARCGLTVGVLNGSHTAEELRVHHPDLLIPDITSLASLVQP